jgi:hypothetical protein
MTVAAAAMVSGSPAVAVAMTRGTGHMPTDDTEIAITIITLTGRTPSVEIIIRAAALPLLTLTTLS